MLKEIPSFCKERSGVEQLWRGTRYCHQRQSPFSIQIFNNKKRKQANEQKKQETNKTIARSGHF